jgi:hypothetical protein
MNSVNTVLEMQQTESERKQTKEARSKKQETRKETGLNAGVV